MAEQLQITNVALGLIGIASHRGAPGAVTPLSEAVDRIHRRLLPDPYNFLRVTTEPDISPLLVHWGLTNGRNVAGTAVVYAFQLPGDYEGVVLRCLVSVRTPLSIDETVEMMAMLRGTHERMREREPQGLTFSPQKTMDKLPRDGLLERLGVTSGNLLPYCQVRRFTPSVETAEETKKRFADELYRLSNLWVPYSGLTDRSVARAFADRDLHPFEHGATFVTPVCTLTVHPGLNRVHAKLRRQTVEEASNEQWTVLTGFLSLVLLQRVAIQDDVRLLVQLVESTANHPVWRPDEGLRRLHLLSGKRRIVLQRLSLYNDIWLTRKEWADGLVTEARKRLHVENLLHQLNQLLSELNAEVNSLYSAQIAFLALLIGLLALVVSVVSLF